MGNGEEMGKMMARLLKGQTGAEARPAGIEGSLRLGDSILLRKREVKQGQTSPVATGGWTRGTYLSPLERGKSFTYAQDGNTSAVRDFRTEGDVLVIETQTSIYELKKA